MEQNTTPCERVRGLSASRISVIKSSASLRLCDSIRVAAISCAFGMVAMIGGCGSRGGDAEIKPDPERVAKLRDAARIDIGDLAPMKSAREQLVTALELGPADPLTLARFAEVDGLGALLYGIPVTEENAFDPRSPGDPGWRDWAIGKAAFELSRIKSVEQLAAVDGLLAELAKTDKDDPWRIWLQGRSALVAGDRVRASTLFTSTKLPLATIDQANLLAEDGRASDAERVLAPLVEPTRTHVLATLARAIARAEIGDVAGAVKDLGELPADAPPRLHAYRLLGEALVGLANERYDLTGDALAKLGGMKTLPADCQLWERVVWLHLQLGRGGAQGRGDHRAATVARQHCTAYGKATPNPALQRADAGLQLALGKPERARSIAERVPGLWGQLLIAAADLELGLAEPALAALDASAKQSPPKDSPELRVAQVLRLEARVMFSKDKARTEVLAELDGIADQAKSQHARHALGAAYFAIGDLGAAKRELRHAVELTTPESPDPFAYRTHALLAEIALAESDLDTAGQEADRALEIHGGNGVLRVLQARILIRHGEPDRALAALAPVRKEGELSPIAALAVAEALVARKDVTSDQRSQATTLVTSLVGKLPAVELGRVAALVDPKLPAKLKLPVSKPPSKRT